MPRPKVLTDGIGTSNPQPQTFSKLLFLINIFVLSFFLDRLSLALVVVGGSDFFGQAPWAQTMPHVRPVAVLAAVVRGNHLFNATVSFHNFKSQNFKIERLKS